MTGIKHPDSITNAYNEYIVNVGFSIGMSQVREEVEEFVDHFKLKLCKNFLEIGTKWGGNFYILASICSDNSKKISIDLPGAEYGGWVLKEHPYLGDTLTKRNKFLMSNFSNVHLIENNSHYLSSRIAVEKILGHEKLDMLYIDGDHSYDGVKKDYEMYQDLVKKDGWIIFHDINDSKHHRDMGVGVYQLWEELYSKFITKEFNAHKHWAGIGAFKKE
jgi:predicted O-methyltransferase YrrM